MLRAPGVGGLEARRPPVAPRSLPRLTVRIDDLFGER